MTVSTTHVGNTFVGDGVTTVFNFTFQALSSTDIQVLKAGVLQLTGVTVTLNQDQENNPGGNATFLVAPALGVSVDAERVTDITQEVGFTNESKLNTKNLELVMDKLTLLLQEAKARTQGQQGIQGIQGIQGPPGSIGGPVSSHNNSLVLWNGTGGNTIKDGVQVGNEGDVAKVVGGVWAAAAPGSTTVPSGAIWLWDTNMAAIPAGWVPMDGRTVTINGVSKVTADTRGKYVLAASLDDTGSTGYTGVNSAPGAAGGTKTHQHSYSVNGTTGNTNPGTNTAVNNGSSVIIGVKSNAALSHTHTVNINGNTGANLETSRPVGISLLAIIKVD